MRAKTEKVAVVDIGSNSIRLCGYALDSRKGALKKLLDSREFVGLSAYVDVNGIMSDEGIDIGGKTVSKMVRMARMSGFDRVHAFATAAVRNCQNSTQVATAMEKASSCKICVLTGKDEARYSTLGALQSVKIRSGLFLDLGGGSIELSDFQNGKLAHWDSLPMGSLSSWQKLSSGIMPSPIEIEAIRNSFKKLLSTSDVRVAGYSNVCAVGGAARLALKVSRQLRNASASSRNLMLCNLEYILEKAITNPNEVARTVLGIKPARVHTFIPGCVIMHSVLQESGCDSMKVAKTGIREGYLLAIAE
jgi:exopolyphosphatase/guanosine-5'-triphosphate,3'-diphosphate pyrophosphatase